MGEYLDKAKGTINEAVGKARVELGKSVDSPGMIIKGAAQEAKGKAEQLAAEIEAKLPDKK